MPLDPHRFDTDKRPILCQHKQLKKVEADEWTHECKDCGLRFKNPPHRKTGKGRKPRSR